MQVFTSQDITWCNRLLVGYMKKQTHMHFGWPEKLHFYNIYNFGQIINLTHWISNNNNNIIIALIFIYVIVVMLYMVKTKQE